MPPQPRRGDIGAVADRLELEPHHRLDHPFAPGEGAEAAIGRGDDALTIADRRHGGCGRGLKSWYEFWQWIGALVIAQYAGLARGVAAEFPRGHNALPRGSHGRGPTGLGGTRR